MFIREIEIFVLSQNFLTHTYIKCETYNKTKLYYTSLNLGKCNKNESRVHNCIILILKYAEEMYGRKDGGIDELTERCLRWILYDDRWLL